VGDVIIFGARKYAMGSGSTPRSWRRSQLTAADVVSAAAGTERRNPRGTAWPSSPRDPKQNFQVTLRVVGRLSDPKEFESIILKTPRNGIVQVKDVGRAEIGAENYDTNLMYSGHQGVASASQQLSNANAPASG